MGRIRRRLVPYGVVVGEYLLAAGLLYSVVRVMTPDCLDTCPDNTMSDLASIAGGTVLSVGFLVAVIIVAVQRRRAERAGRAQRSGWAAAGVASLAAGTGVLSAVVAMPALWFVEMTAVQVLSSV